GLVLDAPGDLELLAVAFGVHRIQCQRWTAEIQAVRRELSAAEDLLGLGARGQQRPMIRELRVHERDQAADLRCRQVEAVDRFEANRSDVRSAAGGLEAARGR